MIKETDEAVADDRDLHRVPARVHENAHDRDYVTAVSYCWGKSETSTLITLKVKLLGIASNLASLLEQEVWRPNITRRHSCLWVDDHTDIIEKSAQVQQMWRIDECAAAVAMWLCPEMEYTATAFDTLSRLRSIVFSIIASSIDDKFWCTLVS